MIPGSDNALEMLKATSRTFYIPISRLPAKLQAAVTSAYLCMRAIDEIEDHPHLDRQIKVELLRAVSLNLQTPFVADTLTSAFGSHLHVLAPVTIRLTEWALLAPPNIAPRIWDATAAMADRMAYWSDNGWRIQTEADLDRYTFGVAGAVGLLLTDLWAWFDGTRANRAYAIGFGRGLQAVNILRNRAEDLARGVDFFPDRWSHGDMHAYARRNLALADAYTRELPSGPALAFCNVPLLLAHATLGALVRGEGKLSRSDVLHLIEQAIGSPQ